MVGQRTMSRPRDTDLGLFSVDAFNARGLRAHDVKPNALHVAQPITKTTLMCVFRAVASGRALRYIDGGLD